MMNTEECEGADKMGEAIDRLDNVNSSLDIPFTAEQHFGAFKKILPEIIAELKAGFVTAAGHNPWED